MMFYTKPLYLKELILELKYEISKSSILEE